MEIQVFWGYIEGEPINWLPNCNGDFSQPFFVSAIKKCCFFTYSEQYVKVLNEKYGGITFVLDPPQESSTTLT